MHVPKIITFDKRYLSPVTRAGGGGGRWWSSITKRERPSGIILFANKLYLPYPALPLDARKMLCEQRRLALPAGDARCRGVAEAGYVRRFEIGLAGHLVVTDQDLHHLGRVERGGEIGGQGRVRQDTAIGNR